MNDDFIPDLVLTDNTSQRLPCVLVLDGSASMSGEPINELNKGLKLLEQELKNDDTAAQRVQLLVIRLGDDDEVQILTDWTDALEFSAPVVTANGRTPLGVAMEMALEAIEEQKKNYFWLILFLYSFSKSIFSSRFIFLKPHFSNKNTKILLISG